MKNTKAKYIEHLKGLSKEEITKEIEDLSLQLAKAKVMIQQGLNPYYGKTNADGSKRAGTGINVKLVKYKINQLKSSHNMP